MTPSVHTIYLFVYVDDIVITGSNDVQVEGVVTQLSKEFALQRLGNWSYFLGMQVKTIGEGLHKNQTQC